MQSYSLSTAVISMPSAFSNHQEPGEIEKWNWFCLCLCMKAGKLTLISEPSFLAMTPDGSQASFSNDTQEDDGFTFRRARPRRESSSTLNLKRKAIEEFEDFQHPSAPSPKRAHYSQRPSIRQSVASLTSDASVKLSGRALACNSICIWNENLYWEFSLSTDELPHNVPADKLYTALAPELPESERLRQILIWSAKSSLEKSAFARKVYKNQDERIAKEIG